MKLIHGDCIERWDMLDKELICKMYKNGKPMRQIALEFETNHKLISSILKNEKRVVAEFSRRFNVWELSRGKNKTSHPAVFPEQLANDHIISWSNEHDLIYDPFMGSGTTAKMAILNNRNYIGSEISEEYCEIIRKRLEA